MKGIMFKIKKNFRTIISIISILVLNLAFVPISYAGGLSALSDTMSRVADSTPSNVTSNHVIKFTTPTGLLVGGYKMQIDFPAGFTTTGVTYTDMTVTWGPSTGIENSLTLGATPSGATWGAAFTGQQLNITSGTGTITAGSKVIINLTGTNKIINPTAAATYVISAGIYNGATPIDTGKIAVAIIADDQIPVTAGVDPIISFTVANTALALGNISTSAPTYPAGSYPAGYDQITIGTNAHSGYTITVKDIGDGSSPGLFSTTIGGAPGLIASSGVDLSSTNGYGGQCHKDSGSGSCVFALDSGNTVTAFTLGGVTFASHDSKPSGTDTFHIRVGARISTSQEAATDYNDTLTVIGTTNF